jgi:hypothetical protein
MATGGKSSSHLNFDEAGLNGLCSHAGYVDVADGFVVGPVVDGEPVDVLVPKDKLPRQRQRYVLAVVRTERGQTIDKFSILIKVS